MDVVLVRIAVVALGFLGCLCVAGIIYLSSIGVEPPEVLGYSAIGCANAITGILIPNAARPKNGTGYQG